MHSDLPLHDGVAQCQNCLLDTGHELEEPQCLRHMRPGHTQITSQRSAGRALAVINPLLPLASEGQGVA